MYLSTFLVKATRNTLIAESCLSNLQLSMKEYIVVSQAVSSLTITPTNLFLAFFIHKFLLFLTLLRPLLIQGPSSLVLFPRPARLSLLRFPTVSCNTNHLDLFPIIGFSPPKFFPTTKIVE